jgi:formylglycine-generating enzyme required for sulfatase activity
MYGFVIAIMLCNGNNCDLVQAEPDVSYPSFEVCTTALSTKAAALQAIAQKQASADRPARIICLHPIETVVEVEEPHDVIDTAMVHQEPAASSLFVGLVEKGTRTLVTGRVAGTDWVRVLLPDGKSGFVYADRLRKVGGEGHSASVTAGVLPPPRPPAAGATQPAPQIATATTLPPPQPPPVQPAPPASLPTPTSAAVTPALPPPAARTLAAINSAASPASSSSTANSKEFRDCETCPVMVSLPAGTFNMGSNEDPTERPPHHVSVHAFALAKFEATMAEWAACVAAGGCSYKPSAEGSPERRPMTNLSWNDANEYVRWLQKVAGKPYRLPTEAEWEYAAGAGTTSRYGWGEQLEAGKADCKGCGGSHDDHRPADIGTLAPNAWGLYGLEGGVAEWVDDCWHTSYQNAPLDSTPWRSPNCLRHVLRGGSWMNPPTDITVRNRNFYDANVRYIANGMRVALTLH